MKKADMAATAVIFILFILLSVVIFIGKHIPIIITCQLPAACEEVSPFGFIVFEFSRPVKSDQIENLWETFPHLDGKWEWLDDQHVRWNSLVSLPSDRKITLQFQAGQAGQNGERIKNSVRWEVTVRSPQIVFIRSAGEGNELFSTELDDASGKQLTYTNGRVRDFLSLPDNEAIVFSVRNDLEGTDLWIIQRDGSNQHKILDCGSDYCNTPAWSPITQELAFTRESAGSDSKVQKKSARIWIIDFKSMLAAPLFIDPEKPSYNPKWSPDGLWLSIWDESQSGIQVVNRKTGETFFIPLDNESSVSWSPDSQILYYSNLISGETSFRKVVLQADISRRSISTFWGNNVDGGGLSVDNPVCNPQKTIVAVSIQPNVKIPGKKLFLLNSDGEDSITIMDDLSRIPGFYSWTPDGNRLVFQSGLLGGKEQDVEIWIWDRITGEAKEILAGGRSPQWLP